MVICHIILEAEDEIEWEEEKIGKVDWDVFFLTF